MEDGADNQYRWETGYEKVRLHTVLILEFSDLGERSAWKMLKYFTNDYYSS